MTISNTANFKIYEIKSDLTFKIPFPFLDIPEYVWAEVSNDQGNWLTVPRTRFTIKIDPMGNNTLILDEQYLTSKWLKIYRQIPITQTQTFTSQTRYGDATENGLDKLTAILQDLTDPEHANVDEVYDDLVKEINRAIQAENDLLGKIHTIYDKDSNPPSGLLVDETNRAIGKEAGLQDQIDNIQLTPGPEGLQGPEGPQGDPGEGVPSGGATGQVLAKLSNKELDTGWVDQSGGEGQTFTMISSFDLDTLLTLVPNYGDVTFVVASGEAEGGLDFPWVGTVANVTNNREIAAYRALVLSGTALVFGEPPKVETLLKEMSLNKVIPFGGTITSEDSYPNWAPLINYPSIILDKNIVDDFQRRNQSEYKIFGTTYKGVRRPMLALNSYMDIEGELEKEQIEVGHAELPLCLKHFPYNGRINAMDSYLRNIPVEVGEDFLREAPESVERIAYISDLENANRLLQDQINEILSSFVCFRLIYLDDKHERFGYGQSQGDLVKICNTYSSLELFKKITGSSMVDIPKEDIIALETFLNEGFSPITIPSEFLTKCRNLETVDLSGIAPLSVFKGPFLYNCDSLRYVKLPEKVAPADDSLIQFLSVDNRDTDAYLNGIALDGPDDTVQKWLDLLPNIDDHPPYRRLYRYGKRSTDSPVDTVLEQK